MRRSVAGSGYVTMWSLTQNCVYSSTSYLGHRPSTVDRRSLYDGCTSIRTRGTARARWMFIELAGALQALCTEIEYIHQISLDFQLLRNSTLRIDRHTHTSKLWIQWASLAIEFEIFSPRVVWCGGQLTLHLRGGAVLRRFGYI